eukprot:TRINITY_DN67790_c0_g3_i4.p1 TRINITY_DN67790_c0_g3~~TRINITY_DN67790_c0_g3_i4.p1  ORF type:complete len:112 (-),score=0.34 TRINITY_DN67790_c0_g3_i4:52-387(-)
MSKWWNAAFTHQQNPGTGRLTMHLSSCTGLLKLNPQTMSCLFTYNIPAESSTVGCHKTAQITACAEPPNQEIQTVGLVLVIQISLCAISQSCRTSCRFDGNSSLMSRRYEV